VKERLVTCNEEDTDECGIAIGSRYRARHMCPPHSQIPSDAPGSVSLTLVDGLRYIATVGWYVSCVYCILQHWQRVPQTALHRLSYNRPAHQLRQSPSEQSKRRNLSNIQHFAAT